MYIELGSIEKMIYKDAIKNNNRISEINKKGIGITNDWDGVQQDIWGSLYKNKPKRDEEKQGLLGTMLEEMFSSSNFKATRQKTILNKDMATFTSVLMSETFLDSLPKEVKKYEIAKKKLVDQMTVIKQTLKEKNQKMSSEQQAQIKNSMDQLKNQKKDIEENIEDVQQEMRLQSKKALEDAKDKVDAIENIIGGDDAGSACKLDSDELMAFFQMLNNNPDLIKIIKIAGRMKNILVESKFKKLKKTADQTYEIGTGNNLKDTLPSELAYFRIPQTRKLFLKKYTEEKLLVYRKKNRKIEGKGPIICCVDESGSTCGNIILWEKGLAMVLSDMAKKEKRDLFWISFSSQSEIETTHIPKGKFTLTQLMAFVTHCFNGGTCFETPLQECLNIVSTRENKADVIFLTDGSSYLSDEFLRTFNYEKKKKEMKVITICVDGYSDTVKNFSDYTFDLKKDGEDIILEDVFSEL